MSPSLRGTKVVVIRNLGKRKGRYYYGASLTSIPIGSKGKIQRAFKNSYRVSFNGNSFVLKPGEVAFDKRLTKREKTKGETLLEKALLEEEIVEEKDRKRIKPFEPKFNVREEFSVWIRDQFPELKKYASRKKGSYVKLERRKKEVYAAAVLACNHGIKTTQNLC